ncbi:MAG: AAA domain-containing protein [Candidatus Promineifilaceae bacterium]
METLFIEGLPKGFGRTKLMRLLIEEGRFTQLNLGKIELKGNRAIVEFGNTQASRVAAKLDGLQVGTRKIRAWHQSHSAENDSDHFKQLNRWLALEAKAEQTQITQQDRRTESSISRLIIKNEEVGLGGQILVRLTARNPQQSLPFSRLGNGSPIIMLEEGVRDSQGWRGVITQMRRQQIEIALNQFPESEGDKPTFRIQLSSDAIARQRMERALAQASAARGNRMAELRDVLLGQEDAIFSKEAAEPKPHLIESLNASQRMAVQKALSAEDVALIHGPPGTGKTTTLVAIIRAAVQRGDRVLACAPSNMAVDNLASSLVLAGESIVRIGHPARVLPHLQPHTLDAQVDQHDDYRLAKRLRKDAYGLKTNAGKWRRAKPEKGAKQAMRQEAKQLLTEARSLEARAVERVLDSTSILLSTLTALDSRLVGQRQFDLCVIDEAGQSTEPAIWIPLTRAQKVVLAGDHLQLPPTVISQQASDEGFSVSLLEHLMLREPAWSQQLTVQYRMNEQIMAFSSAEFYADSLSAAPSISGHLLSDLVDTSAPILETAITYIDTAGASYDEEREPKGRSLRNLQEAELVVKKVDQLLAAGISPNAIGVITPYSAQVRALNNLVNSEVEVNSVDGFQGREKEAIVISLVRSNMRGEVGFLQETRRMNVALTRARRKLIVIGDSATVTAHPFFANLISYFDSIGAYASVWEELY